MDAARPLGIAAIGKCASMPPVRFGTVTLNQVEGFFGILTKQSLTQTGFPSKKALKEHINAYLKGWNQKPSAFEWTKPANAIIKSHERQKKRLMKETT